MLNAEVYPSRTAPGPLPDAVGEQIMIITLNDVIGKPNYFCSTLLANFAPAARRFGRTLISFPDFANCINSFIRTRISTSRRYLSRHFSDSLPLLVAAALKTRIRTAADVQAFVCSSLSAASQGSRV